MDKWTPEAIILIISGLTGLVISIARAIQTAKEAVIVAQNAAAQAGTAASNAVEALRVSAKNKAHGQEQKSRIEAIEAKVSPVIVTESAGMFAPSGPTRAEGEGEGN